MRPRRRYVGKLPVPEPGKFRCSHPREGNTYHPRPGTDVCRQCRIDRAAAQRRREQSCQADGVAA